MKITQITYARTVSDGNFGNRKIEVVTELEEGDTPEDALTSAKVFVALQLENEEKQDEVDYPF